MISQHINYSTYRPTHFFNHSIRSLNSHLQGLLFQLFNKFKGPSSSVLSSAHRINDFQDGSFIIGVTCRHDNIQWKIISPPFNIFIREEYLCLQTPSTCLTATATSGQSLTKKLSPSWLAEVNHDLFSREDRLQNQGSIMRQEGRGREQWCIGDPMFAQSILSI